MEQRKNNINFNLSITNTENKKYLKKCLQELDWITESMYDVIIYDCWSNFGDYDENIKYAGFGDSSDKNESVTSILIPEFESNYVFYIHDALYDLINKKIEPYDTISIDWRKRADELMKTMMKYKEIGFLSNIYYFFVRLFG